MRRLLGPILMGTLILGTSSSGCFEGGANFNQQAPGNNDQGGVDLGGGGGSTWTGGEGGESTLYSYGAIAVAPSGAYFLSASGGQLIFGDLKSGQSSLVAGVGAPSRVAFGAKAARFYLSSAATGQVYALDAGSRKVLWQASSTGTLLYPSKDDKLLLVADDQVLTVRDAATGEKLAETSPGTIVDVDITPDSQRAVITLQHSWGGQGGAPSTKLLVLDLASWSTKTIEVPNCSSPLVLTPDGKKAFLAPTFCNKDPVSVIDLVEGTFVKNLPGFGPVDMASDGVTAVAFVDAQDLDLSLFDDPADAPSPYGPRFHIMLLDTQTMTFATVPLGDSLPRYALTPDGKIVLVDSGGWFSSGGIRILDVKTRQLQQVSGADVQLDHFVVSPSSKDVYLLYVTDLYWLSIPQKTVKPLSTPFGCQAINITPDGGALLLLDPSGTLHLYDLIAHKVIHSLPPPAATGT